MCFRIDKEATTKLQKRKAPIKGFKFVAKKNGKLVSERTSKFVYPEKGTVEVKRPKAEGNNPYDSTGTLNAKTGIYFYLGKPKPEHFIDHSSHILLLSVEPSDILGTNGTILAVAKKVTVLKAKAVSTPDLMDAQDKLYQEYDKKKEAIDKLYDKKIRAAETAHSAKVKKFIASL